MNTERHQLRVVPPTPVTTMLSPMERVHVDVAARGSFKALHRSSIDEILNDLREHRADVVLLSVARYDSLTTARIALLAHEFPRIPAFAVISDVSPSTPHSALSLGHLGIRKLIDARHPSGWETLHDLLVREQSNDIQRVALSLLNIDLVSIPDDCWRFFELLFTHRPQVVNVCQLARLMHVLPSTLISRFYRVRLPSPKRYIDVGRLIRAARFLENPGLSVSTVARQLEYSSPQAFSRHVRCVMGMSPVDFRHAHTGLSMLAYFREELILPHIHTLRSFHPISAKPGWVPE